MTQLRKGSKEAKARMSKVRSSIGKSKPKPKRVQQVTFRTKSGKVVSFRGRR